MEHEKKRQKQQRQPIIPDGGMFNIRNRIETWEFRHSNICAMCMCELFVNCSIMNSRIFLHCLFQMKLNTEEKKNIFIECGMGIKELFLFDFSSHSAVIHRTHKKYENMVVFLAGNNLGGKRDCTMQISEVKNWKMCISN